jgi:hypothetical protein
MELFCVFEALLPASVMVLNKVVLPGDTWLWNEFIQPVTVFGHLEGCG